MIARIFFLSIIIAFMGACKEKGKGPIDYIGNIDSLSFPPERIAYTNGPKNTLYILDTSGAMLAGFVPTDYVRTVKMSNRWIAFTIKNPLSTKTSLHIIDYDTKPMPGFKPVEGIDESHFAIADDTYAYILNGTVNVFDNDHKLLFQRPANFIRSLSNNYIGINFDNVDLLDHSGSLISTNKNSGYFRILNRFVINQNNASVNITDFTGKTLWTTNSAQSVTASSHYIFLNTGKHFTYNGVKEDNEIFPLNQIELPNNGEIISFDASNSFIFLHIKETEGPNRYQVSYLFDLSGKQLIKDTRYPENEFLKKPVKIWLVSDQYAVCRIEKTVVEILDRNKQKLPNFKPIEVNGIFLKNSN